MLCALMLIAVSQAEVTETRLPKAVEKRIALQALKKSDEWTKLNDHLDNLTNSLAKLDPDIITATNKIALITDVASAKLAIQKVQNEVEDLAKIVADAKVLFKDLKQLQVKIVEILGKR
jgi:hypothetical protein